MNPKIIKYWKPLAAVSLWGMSFIATKIALDELAPKEIIFSRLVLAALFLLILALISRKDLSISLKQHKPIFILSLIAVFHLWIQVTGMQWTTASNTGWIIGITPVFMAIIGFVFFRESLGFVKISGILIAFFGLLLLISKGNFSNINLIQNKGDLLVLGSAFTWSVYSAVNKKITVSYSPLLTILFLFLMMSIIISPFTINSEFISKISNLRADIIFAIIFLGIFCSGAAYVFWAQSLREMDSITVGAFLYLEPFVTFIAAWLVLSEQITFLILFSGIIITVGVVLVNINLKMVLKKFKTKKI